MLGVKPYLRQLKPPAAIREPAGQRYRPVSRLAARGGSLGCPRRKHKFEEWNGIPQALLERSQWPVPATDEDPDALHGQGLGARLAGLSVTGLVICSAVDPDRYSAATPILPLASSSVSTPSSWSSRGVGR
jgi:hypothetical protein